MYSGLTLSFGLIQASQNGVALSPNGLSYAGGENDGSSTITEWPLLAPACVLALILIKISPPLRLNSTKESHSVFSAVVFTACEICKIYMKSMLLKLLLYPLKANELIYWLNGPYLTILLMIETLLGQFNFSKLLNVWLLDSLDYLIIGSWDVWMEF